MNIKNIMKTFACAGACAVSSMAFADFADWFSGDAKATSNASWNDPDGVEIVEGKFVLENDADTALVLTPTAALGDDATKIVEVTATAVLTPSDVDDLPQITDAKAGFAVARYTNDSEEALGFYGYNGDTWTLITGTPIPSGPDANDVYPETTFTIVLNYRDGTVSFKVGGVALNETLTLPEKTTALTSVDAFGTGSLASIDANYELGAYIVDGKAYASLDDVPEAKRKDAVLDDAGLTKIVQGIEKFADVTAAGNLVAWLEAKGIMPTTDKIKDEVSGVLAAKGANGMTGLTSYALDLDPNDATSVLKAVPVENDTATDKITLTVGDVTPKAGFTVTYQVKNGDKVETTTTTSTAIQVPLATGHYTVEAVVE